MKEDIRLGVLDAAFPTWKEVEVHKEVVHFLCGLLAEGDATCITDHVAQLLLQHTHDQLNRGETLSVLTDMTEPSVALMWMEAFQKEGCVSGFNQYLSVYPERTHVTPDNLARAHSNKLCDILCNTHLVIITELEETDKPLTDPGSAEVIVDISEMDSDKFYQLWHVLQSMEHSNILALSFYDITSECATKLENLSQMKYLRFCDVNCKVNIANLSKSIAAWGSEAKLRYLQMDFMTIPGSFLTAVSTCSHLRCTQFTQCNFSDGLAPFMVCPPQGMTRLTLAHHSLHREDVTSLAEAFAQNKLRRLEHLDVSRNHVGKLAITTLLEAVLSSRPSSKMEIDITNNNEGNWAPPFSEQFINELKLKFSGTNIAIKNN